MLEVCVYNLDGKIVDNVKLPEELFGKTPREASIHDAVLAYLANRRSGSASTKRRGEVRGSGRKLWRQKGTGRARVADIRSPTRRGGGCVFGPKPRDYSIRLPKRVKREALVSSLSNAALKGNIILLDSLRLKEPKTSKMVAILKNLGLNNVLILVEKIDPNLLLASRNIRDVEITEAANLNTYQVLRHDKLVITREGLAKLEERLLKGA